MGRRERWGGGGGRRGSIVEATKGGELVGEREREKWGGGGGDREGVGRREWGWVLEEALGRREGR